MSKVPEDLIYLPAHIWARVANGVATVGVTDHGQKGMGELISCDFPGAGTIIESDEILGSLESAKTVIDLPSPVSGEIIEINELLEREPRLVNEDPYGKGWIAKIRISEEPRNFLDARVYEKFCDD